MVYNKIGHVGFLYWKLTTENNLFRVWYKLGMVGLFLVFLLWIKISVRLNFVDSQKMLRRPSIKTQS